MQEPVSLGHHHRAERPGRSRPGRSARHGDLDQAIHHGLAAFGYDRKTEASLLARPADLDHILAERYPGERLADDFRERYINERAALRRRAHAHA